MIKESSKKEELTLEKRIKGFNEELRILCGKYKLGLSASPVFLSVKEIPYGSLVAAKLNVFDDSKSFEQKEKLLPK